MTGDDSPSLLFNTLRMNNGNIRISFLQRPIPLLSNLFLATSYSADIERTDNGCLMTIRTDDLRSLLRVKRSAMSDVGVIGPPELYLLLQSTCGP